MPIFHRFATAAAGLAVLASLAGCGVAHASVPSRTAPAAVEALARAQGEAQIRAFVRAWFKLLDRNAPTASYLPLIDDEGLNMRFPERTLRSHADFADWYGGILRTIAKAKHTLKAVEVTQRGAGSFDVHVIVLWEATTTQGEQVSFLADQAWKVHAVAGKLRISEYLVSAAKP